jgi:selenocysteine-specific elongation factor
VNTSGNSSGTAPPLTIGTAGHIDHGKTLLIEKLTGMRADRPYERERGMTIDIGYAEMRDPQGQRIGFIDLPGHERFIRNMVAGATGIDLALLVVAADDGVMPQTREHLDILDLLGVSRGVVVLNKVDLVDEEMRELATEELREFLEGSTLEGAPILPCSAVTGEGIETVRSAIFDSLEEVARRETPGAFFCTVQRSFAAAGFGCIVTGVPAAGEVEVGQDVELLPSGDKARVRAIEIYHESAESARAGHRTALNLSGVHHDQVERGMVVAKPGVFTPARHLAVEIRMLEGARRALKHAGPIRFLTGTLEGMAKAYLLEGSTLDPGQHALIEVRTREPIAVRDGDPFILRTDNARETLGGGRVVAALDAPIGRRATERQARLRRWRDVLPDAHARVRFVLEEDGPIAAPELARRTQFTLTWVKARLEADADATMLPGGKWTTETAVVAAAEKLAESVTRMHTRHPLLAVLPIAEVRNDAGLDEAMLGAALERIGDRVVVDNRTIRRTGHSVDLDPETERAAASVREVLRAAGYAPPVATQFSGEKNALTYLRDCGELREVQPGVLYLRETLEEGIRVLSRVSEKRGSFEPVDAKAALGDISRKWLIPLLEYYDRIGATRRDGNIRQLTNKGRAMVVSGLDEA